VFLKQSNIKNSDRETKYELQFCQEETFAYFTHVYFWFICLPGVYTLIELTGIIKS